MRILKPRYSRILLKLSGEALAGSTGYGIDTEVLRSITLGIKEAHAMGAGVAIVIGGGNILRGVGNAIVKDRVTADYMGMFATVINALALQDSIVSHGMDCRVMSALEVTGVIEPFVRARALKHLERGRVIVFAGGTGSPFFTTDTTAALRALEIGADVLIKATKVDGVYSKDPEKYPDARFYPVVDYVQALEQRLGVMDMAAVSLCRDNGLEIRVISIKDPMNLKRLLEGNEIGSVVRGG